MIPAKMIVTFEDGSSVDIDFYRKVEGTGWIAKAQDPMGAEGPGMDWPEALLNCLSAVESIRKGEPPAWVGQEIRRFKRKLDTDEKSTGKANQPITKSTPS